MPGLKINVDSEEAKKLLFGYTTLNVGYLLKRLADVNETLGKELDRQFKIILGDRVKVLELSKSYEELIEQVVNEISSELKEHCKEAKIHESEHEIVFLKALISCFIRMIKTTSEKYIDESVRFLKDNLNARDESKS
jgi:hypothetical protein